MPHPPRPSLFVFVAVTDQIQRARFQPLALAPVDQRIFLPVSDPDFARTCGVDGCSTARPNRRDPETTRGNSILSAARGRARASSRKRRQRQGSGKRRVQISVMAEAGASVIVPREVGFLHAFGQPQFAKRNAAAFIVAGNLFHRAVQIDRRVVAGLTDQRDHALSLAE